MLYILLLVIFGTNASYVKIGYYRMIPFGISMELIWDINSLW